MSDLNIFRVYVPLCWDMDSGEWRGEFLYFQTESPVEEIERVLGGFKIILDENIGDFPQYRVSDECLDVILSLSDTCGASDRYDYENGFVSDYVPAIIRYLEVKIPGIKISKLNPKSISVIED